MASVRAGALFTFTREADTPGFRLRYTCSPTPSRASVSARGLS